MDAPRIYLCHAPADEAVATELSNRLAGDGISCWLTGREQAEGELRALAMCRGIEHCAGVVVLMTANTATAQYVPSELQMAVTLRKPIVAYQTQECTISRQLNNLLTTAARIRLSQPAAELEPSSKGTSGTDGDGADENACKPDYDALLPMLQQIVAAAKEAQQMAAKALEEKRRTATRKYRKNTKGTPTAEEPEAAYGNPESPSVIDKVTASIRRLLHRKKR